MRLARSILTGPTIAVRPTLSRVDFVNSAQNLDGISRVLRRSAASFTPQHRAATRLANAQNHMDLIGNQMVSRQVRDKPKPKFGENSSNIFRCAQWMGEVKPYTSRQNRPHSRSSPTHLRRTINYNHSM